MGMQLKPQAEIVLMAAMAAFGISPDELMDSKPTKQIGKWEPVTPRNKHARNEPCPCGSGQKFKRCCALTSHYLTERKSL